VVLAALHRSHFGGKVICMTIEVGLPAMNQLHPLCIPSAHFVVLEESIPPFSQLSARLSRLLAQNSSRSQAFGFAAA
jgi:hypothetical protein